MALNRITHYFPILFDFLHEKFGLINSKNLCLAIQSALGKVNLFTATVAYMSPVKFIRKDLFFLATFRAFAVKRF